MNKKLIKNKAYKLFSDWISNAKKVYPDLNYEINEPAVLESDLEDALDNAINALIKEEKVDKRKKKGYDYGYTCGFIQGNLNARWYNEYIKKQSNIYKMFTAVSVLESYLNFNDLLKIRIASLFTEHYTGEVNLSNLNTTIETDLPPKLNFLDIDNPDNPILVTLANIKMQMINEVYEEDIPDFMPEIDKYFSTEDIDEILN